MESLINPRVKSGKFEFLYSISLLFTLVYMVAQPIWHNPTITGVIWKTGIILLFLSSLFATDFTFSKKRLFGFTVLLFVMSIGLLDYNTVVDSSLIFSCISFFCMLLELYFFGGIEISKKLFNNIYKFAVVLTLLFFSYTFTSIAHTFYYRESFTTSIYFVFNLDNPNTVGIYLYSIFCIILVNVPKRKYRLFNIILLVLNFYMIYNTNCRSALFAAIGVVALSLIPFVKKMPKFFIVLAWALPIIFVFAYLALYESGYDDIMIFNKNLFSGRQETYKEFLVLLYEPWHYWFGNLGESQLQNAHNAPLAFYTSLGIIGAVITELMLLFSVYKVNKPTKNSFLSVASIMGLFISSSAEAGMFLGGFPGVVFLTSFFLLANYKESDALYD